ncbi:kinase-like domain-containing protein, partial [Lentinula aff. lateritia]
LERPNILQYLGFEETPGMSSVFLEYVSGGSTRELMLKHGNFDEDTIKSFSAQILFGLEYPHSEGILHRVRISCKAQTHTNDTCKISDFGDSEHIMPLIGDAVTSEGSEAMTLPSHIIQSSTVENVYDNTILVDGWSVGCITPEMCRKKIVECGSD